MNKVEENDNVMRFTSCIEELMIKMQEADNTCLELTKDISKREFSVILFVEKNEEVIMKQIADYMGIPVSTTTGVIDKLVDKGFLKRIHSKEDRRAIKIVLSKYGLDCVSLLESTLCSMSKTMLGGLTKKEEESLITLLEKVIFKLKDHIPEVN